jgi:DNA invertase Pin-like site-specific DNA recombinase
MNPPPPTQVTGYIRASTPQQRSTILTQYETIERHCQTYGFTRPVDIVRTVPLDDGSQVDVYGCFIDAGVSAEKVDFLLREDAAAMLSFMQAYGVKDIVGTKVDRVFRDVDDCRFTVRQLEAEGIRFHLLDVGGLSVTVETAAGLFFLTIMSAVAEYENGRRSERQVENYASQRKRRNLTGSGILLGEVPYGWRKHRHEGNKVQALIRDPKQWAVVERLLQGDLRAVSDNSAARQLNREGIKAKKGGQWHGATIASVRRHACAGTTMIAPPP